jgi:hypothetical protein
MKRWEDVADSLSVTEVEDRERATKNKRRISSCFLKVRNIFVCELIKLILNIRVHGQIQRVL